MYQHQIVKGIFPTVTGKYRMMNVERVELASQFPFAPGTDALLSCPEGQRFPRHGFPGKAEATLLHIFFPFPIIRVTLRTDVHMTNNWYFRGIEDGFPVLIREYPVISGDLGEILLFHPGRHPSLDVSDVPNTTSVSRDNPGGWHRPSYSPHV